MGRWQLQFLLPFCLAWFVHHSWDPVFAFLLEQNNVLLRCSITTMFILLKNINLAIKNKLLLSFLYVKKWSLLFENLIVQNSIEHWNQIAPPVKWKLFTTVIIISILTYLQLSSNKSLLMIYLFVINSTTNSKMVIKVFQIMRFKKSKFFNWNAFYDVF
jgi:hypothetical protein